jgi:hypothetical protein
VRRGRRMVKGWTSLMALPLLPCCCRGDARGDVLVLGRLGSPTSHHGRPGLVAWCRSDHGSERRAVCFR